MTTKQRTPMLHPHHDQIHQTIHGWFHNPMDAMGLRAIVRHRGTYWDHGEVHLSPSAPDALPALLAEVAATYCRCMRPRICIDDANQASQLGPTLVRLGWVRAVETIFLAHVGVFPGGRTVDGLTIAPVNADNLAAFARTRLMASSDPNAEPAKERLAGEIAQRGAEMTGSGRGRLALINGAAAGALWSYEEANDLWISFLGVRRPFRRQGIAQALLKTSVAAAYGSGFRSVVINMRADNGQALRLYQRLGFRDEVYRQWCYRESSGPGSSLSIAHGHSANILADDRICDRYCDRFCRRFLITPTLY